MKIKNVKSELKKININKIISNNKEKRNKNRKKRQ